MNRERTFIQRIASGRQALRVDEVAPLAAALQVTPEDVLHAAGVALSTRPPAGLDPDIVRTALEEFLAACKQQGVRLDKARPEDIARAVLYLHRCAVERGRDQVRGLASDIVGYEAAPGGSLPVSDR